MRKQGARVPRFAVLEHSDAPDDPTGRHFDLLLEAGNACRTWRLMLVPLIDGPLVAAVEIAPHRLAWLEHRSGEVSGGRGYARQIAAGSFALLSADAAELGEATALIVQLTGEKLSGRLRLEGAGEGWVASLANPSSSNPHEAA